MRGSRTRARDGRLDDGATGERGRSEVGLDTTSILTMPPAIGARPRLRILPRATLDELDELPAPTDPTASNEDQQPLREGTVLAGTRLRIDGFLGKGATSVVYRGHDLDLRRPLAIKILHESDDDALRERFVAEARFAACLRSEYIARATAVGELADGRLYYTMRLARGATVATQLRKGPLTARRVLAIVRMACKALAAAHAEGIVHRDIKPANMVLERHRGRQRLVLLDFGIAGRTGRPCDGLWGTPRYMPPEQIRGERVDARADIYALGCCAFEMLSGKPLFNGNSAHDVLIRHLDPSPLVLDGPTDIPAALHEVIEQCVAIDPDARPSSAAELEARLCEAQIEAGLSSPVDRLETPDVAPARRDEIVAGLLRLRRGAGPQTGAGWWILMAVLFGILLLLAHLAVVDVQRSPRAEVTAPPSVGALSDDPFGAIESTT